VAVAKRSESSGAAAAAADPEQYQRFLDAARELGCGDSEERFAEVVRKVASHRPPRSDAAQSVTIKADNAPLLAALAELTAAELPPHIRLRLLDLGQLAPKLVRLEVDNRPALGATEVLVTLQPSELLLDLLAAVRAGDGEVQVVESPLRHEA
jgi:hypothetical protein